LSSKGKSTNILTGKKKGGEGGGEFEQFQAMDLHHFGENKGDVGDEEGTAESHSQKKKKK